MTGPIRPRWISDFISDSDTRIACNGEGIGNGGVSPRSFVQLIPTILFSRAGRRSLDLGFEFVVGRIALIQAPWKTIAVEMLAVGRVVIVTNRRVAYAT